MKLSCFQSRSMGQWLPGRLRTGAPAAGVKRSTKLFACAWCMCMPVGAGRGQRGYCIPWNWRYRSWEPYSVSAGSPSWSSARPYTLLAAGPALHCILVLLIYLLIFAFCLFIVCVHMHESMMHSERAAVVLFSNPVIPSDWNKVILAANALTQQAISKGRFVVDSSGFCFLFLLNVYDCCLHVCLCIPGTHGGWKKAPEPLELELQSHHVDAGN